MYFSTYVIQNKNRNNNKKWNLFWTSWKSAKTKLLKQKIIIKTERKKCDLKKKNIRQNWIFFIVTYNIYKGRQLIS
jgi:hypothetical protein